MLAVEQPRGDNFFGLQPSLDNIQLTDMDFVAPLQYQQEWYSTEQLDVKPQMNRATSTNSVYEYAPGLSASNGSCRSGSSSTVGSPYSGPSLNYSHDDAYLYNSMPEHGAVNMMPGIVNQESYGINDFSSEVPMPFDKLNGHFVGEFADLSSSQHRSAAFRFPTSQPESLSISPAALLNTRSPPSNATANSAQSAQFTHSSPHRSSVSPQTAQTPIFKSPTTPASAYPKTPAGFSPQKRSRQPNVQHHAQPMANYGPFQTHFFNQSSGSYTPDSPCRSSLAFVPCRSVFASSTTHNSAKNIRLTFSPPDPTLIGSYPEPHMYSNSNYHHTSPMPSPAPSPQFYNAQFSQPITHDGYLQQPYPQMMRQPSHGSHYSSALTHASPSSEFEDGGDRRCPYQDCGKLFKDLKAHLLTHQAERPEKCPITTCEYHRKGFSRKYDKNRHTLTHYKGTMVCGFCPGSGTPSEKSFNRADVFKRHLCSVHNVEQAPPNSRKRSPTGSTKKLSSYCADATGKCSTCNSTFNNAQDFYEHLDECVMRVVQQEEPTEAINEQHLSSVAADQEVKESLERHLIKTEEESIDLQLDEEDDEEEDDSETEGPSYSNRPAKKSKPAVLHGGIRKGLTWSKGGVKVASKRKQKKNNYPPSWGMSADRVTMKKRVLVCYNGERRLVKDDMMLQRDYEVRVPLNDGESYITDLDVETLNRADGFHGATAEERGPWVLDESAANLDIGELMG